MLNPLSLVEQFLDGFSARFQGTLDDHCDLEAAFRDSNYILTRSGGCMSMARIDGLKRVYGDDEIPSVFSRLWPVIAAASALHDVELTYVRDPERGQQAVRDNLDRLSQRAARAGIADLGALTADWSLNTPVTEALYTALWTHPRLLTRSERHRDNQLYSQRMSAGGDFRYCQHPFRAYEQLIHTHSAAAETFFERLQNATLAVTPLDADGALTVIKELANPHQSRWHPQLIGDPLAGCVDYPGLTSLFWQPLGQQLFDSEAERISRTFVKIGERYYASVQFTQLPRRLERFSALRLDRTVPVRLRVWLTPWPRSARIAYQINRFLAGVMNWPGHERNNLTVEATKSLQPWIEAGETRAMRIVATTWADSERGIRLCLEKLTASLQHWGLSEVKPVLDEPLSGCLSTLPGLGARSAGRSLLAPPALTTFLPVDLPASVFADGLLFRTPQGRPWCYSPLSDEQAAWVTLMTGPQGYGKSILLAAENLHFICGSGELPYLGLVEIKPSAKGLFQLLRELAVPEVKKRISYRALRAQVEDAINPFSTMLGCRLPLPPHREALIKLLLCLGYAFDAKAPEKNTSELITMLVEEVYKHYLDDSHGNPKKYTRGLNGLVDERLAAHGIQPRTFFEAADRLFAVGDVEAAELAHEQAMPLLGDAAVILKQSDRIRAGFGSARTADGQPLIDYVHQQWLSALPMFPQLQAPTRVQLGAARIIGFDLEAIAPQGHSERERRITTVAYLLARHLVARFIFLRPEHQAHFAPPYQDYARQLLEESYACPKRLSYDEVHLFKGIEAAESQMVYDARVARSQHWSLGFATQLLTDIPPELWELSTTRFIVGSQTKTAVDYLHSMFPLTDGERYALIHHIHAPTRAGSHLLALFDTRRHGTVVQHLQFPCPPRWLWAMATDRDNAVLRDTVCRKIDYRQALDALAGRFPSGSIKAELDALVYERPEYSRGQLLAQLVETVVEYHIMTQRLAHPQWTPNVVTGGGENLSENPSENPSATDFSWQQTQNPAGVQAPAGEEERVDE